MIENAVMRRSVRLLAAVHELHKQGFQDLAVYARMGENKTDWCCDLLPFNQLILDQAKLEPVISRGLEEACHSSGTEGYLYFGWLDAQLDSARDLADKIRLRFPQLLERCKRPNYRYAGWYTYMLGLAEEGHLPVMQASYVSSGSEFIASTTQGLAIAVPPHEKLWQFGGKSFVYQNPPHLNSGDDWHDAYRAIIDRWRTSEIAYLPKYPSETNDIFEIGGYWEGAIYYIQAVLSFTRIDEFLSALSNPDNHSERWQTLFSVWNDQGQFQYLKAFLIRTMLGDRQKYPLEREERSYWDDWLIQFERASIDISRPDFRGPNPYFGGNNPLHLGLILSRVSGDKLFTA